MEANDLPPAPQHGPILPDSVALMLDTALHGDCAPNGTPGVDGRPRSKNLTVLVGAVRVVTTARGESQRMFTDLGAAEYRYELSINEVVGDEQSAARTSYRLPITMGDACVRVMNIYLWMASELRLLVRVPVSCQTPMLSAEVLEQVVLDVVFADLKERSQETLLVEINAAVEQRRAELVKAIELAGERLVELEQRRSAALDALTFQFKNVSERIRAVLAEQADAAIAVCDETEEQIRKLRLGIDVLDEKARAIELTLTDPFLEPTRWNEPEAHFALKRALNLLVHAMTLQEEGPRAYYVEVEIYEIRESVSLESAWGSNPPARLVTPPTSFED